MEGNAGAVPWLMLPNTPRRCAPTASNLAIVAGEMLVTRHAHTPHVTSAAPVGRAMWKEKMEVMKHRGGSHYRVFPGTYQADPS